MLVNILFRSDKSISLKSFWKSRSTFYSWFYYSTTLSTYYQYSPICFFNILSHCYFIFYSIG